MLLLVYECKQGGDKMEYNNINLTDAEWNIMECLWENPPKTGRETIDYMKEAMGWNRSTTLTLLRRLEEKSALYSETLNDVKVYYPAISREQAALKETNNFLGKVYNGSLSMMLSTFTQKQNLSKNEIQELYDILKEMEANADD